MRSTNTAWVKSARQTLSSKLAETSCGHSPTATARHSCQIRPIHIRNVAEFHKSGAESGQNANKLIHKASCLLINYWWAFSRIWGRLEPILRLPAAEFAFSTFEGASETTSPERYTCTILLGFGADISRAIRTIENIVRWTLFTTVNVAAYRMSSTVEPLGTLFLPCLISNSDFDQCRLCLLSKFWTAQAQLRTIDWGVWTFNI